MNQRRNFIILLAICVLSVTPLVFLPGWIYAGDLNPPSGPPGPTMKTLDQIRPTWSRKLPCDETACPRFEVLADFNNEAVLDKETGLVWSISPITWTPTPDIQGCYVSPNAICADACMGGRKGWRGPTPAELLSLVDLTQMLPALPAGHPFLNVQRCYWTICPPQAVNVDFGYVGIPSMVSEPNCSNFPYNAGVCPSGGGVPKFNLGELQPPSAMCLIVGPQPPPSPPTDCFIWCVRGQ
jgi:hypothetical protein